MMMKLIPIVACLLIQAVPILGQTVIRPNLEVSLSNPGGGPTHALNVNCSFKMEPTYNLAALISLSISHAEEPEQTFTELANVNQYSQSIVNQISTANTTVVASFDPAGESYLHLHWEYPTAAQSGYYRCTAMGFDTQGHPVEMIGSTQITVEPPSLESCLSSLKDVTANLKNVENELLSLKQNYSELTLYVHNLERNMSIMNLIQSSPLHFVTKGTAYIVSNSAFTSDDDAMLQCAQMGGHLAVMDNAEEYKDIQTFLASTSGIAAVAISGTDEATLGTWLLSSSNQPLPFVDWGDGQPSAATYERCLVMWVDEGWRMANWPCDRNPPYNNERFLCEVPLHF